jgi:hypothetical protein
MNGVKEYYAMRQRLGVLLVLALAAFAQTDRGSIGGTVSDSTNAVIPDATVTAMNPATGAQYQASTTATGNYILPSLPAGVYTVTVEVSGFKKYVQEGIGVQVAQTARVDVVLEVGSATESVTVVAAAPLLRTDSAEQSYVLPTATIDTLPINFGARGGWGGSTGTVRDPYAFVQLVPGTRMDQTNNIRINGLPQDTFTVRIEGQEATNSLDPERSDQSQPSAEEVEEVSVQSSNFAAEFGQIGGGMFNFEARSGTNQLHGSVYDYFVNEALNAGIPFTNNGNGGLVRPRKRENNWGFRLGGPVWLPKIYNGRDKTFFFFNFEQFRLNEVDSGVMVTIPTMAMRNGDFSQILTGRTLNTDPLGRAILENTIYDPNSQRIVNGQTVRDPFVGNVIPTSRLSPIAQTIDSWLPAPTNSGLVNNWDQVYPNARLQDIATAKMDHTFGVRAKISAYYSHYRSHHQTYPDGLPVPITTGRVNRMRNHTARLNYDNTVTPRLLFHVGIGFMDHLKPDTSAPGTRAYNSVTQLGLVGALGLGFPEITGLASSYGGFSIPNSPGYGMDQNKKTYIEKPTAVVSTTYTLGSHIYKAGVEWRQDGYLDKREMEENGIWNFAATETGLPSTLGQSLAGGVTGFPYASFMLGLADTASVNTFRDPQWRKMSWSMFVQDTWKVTRKLTLDYGIRYDLQGQWREIHDRMSIFSPTTPNPSAGGLLGAVLYAGHGPGTCNCDSFTSTYPYGVGPRLGVAYQIDSKTVFRGAWGIAYGDTAPANYLNDSATIGVGGWNELTFVAPAYGSAAATFAQGLPYTSADMYGHELDPGIRPTPGQLNSPPYMIDRNGGRPPRITQWNIGLQRTITTNLLAEAAYVGNRGAWFQANALVDLNALTPARIQAAGLNINAAADRSVLTSYISSSLAAARGFAAPYAGFPALTTVAQSLRPFPMYGSIPELWAPLGDNWYNALQAKLTKRTSHGLTVTSAFTYQKELTTVEAGSGATVPINDVFNRPNQRTISGNSQPFLFVIGYYYELPAWGPNRWMRAAVRGWMLGGILRYGSGLPIPSPCANNGLNAVLLRTATCTTFANRVSGQPLFLQDLNGHNFDPNKNFVLNPAAWSDPAPGQWGTSAAYYNDYRYQRRPDEEMSLGRTFRIRERMTATVRAEFFNVFNRTEMNDPTATNALATQSRAANGNTISGFGYINTGSVYAQPRNGQIVARFEF